MTRRRRSILQWLREEPVLAVRIIGSAISVIVTEFALPISDPMKELIQLVIICYLIGPGALEIWMARRAVTPDAKTERLASEGPQVNEKVYHRKGKP